MTAWRSRVSKIAFASLAFLLAATTSVAQTTSGPRVVLKGYDPVAYFTDGRPVKGSPQNSYDWDGERYHFASAANRDKFAANPERYAPEFGGYCTGSMARNVRNEADPEAWIISDGKLYVFGQVKFMNEAKNNPGYLAERVPLATVNWRAKK